MQHPPRYSSAGSALKVDCTKFSRYPFSWNTLVCANRHVRLGGIAYAVHCTGIMYAACQ
jgi:hypothetical protein